MKQLSPQEQSDFLSALKSFGKAEDVPNISEKNAQFLRDIIFCSGAKTILELGTANGYSTIQFAFELQNANRAGHITTIDFSPASYEMAQKNFYRAGVTEMITSLFGNVLDELPKLPDAHFDFIFIDAMKKRSLEFFLMALKKIKPGGIIVIDDVLKFQHKMPDLFPYFEQHAIAHSILPIDEDDGILMYVHKKRIEKK